MANTIRIHPTISLVAYQHLEAAIAAGETLSGIINRLLIHQLPKPHKLGGRASKPTDLDKYLKELLKRSTPYSDRVSDGSITFAERDEWYEILEQIAQTKIALGTETRDLDEVMQAHYNREYEELLDTLEYDTPRYNANEMNTKERAEYEETKQRINTLKERLN